MKRKTIIINRNSVGFIVHSQFANEYYKKLLRKKKHVGYCVTASCAI